MKVIGDLPNLVKVELSFILAIHAFAHLGLWDFRNISVQTMAGRREKARQGGWNGAKPPYGYKLVDGKLEVLPEEADHVKLIFDKYVNTNLGIKGVARWMNNHGYKKIINTHNGLEVFTESFIDSILTNETYIGKIAYGKRKTVLRDGSEDVYHKVETDEYMVYEGHHEALIDEATWRAAHGKRSLNGGRRQKLDEDHEYIYSALVKCPICGKSLYGIPMRVDKRKDGTPYPQYYAYTCRSHPTYNGITCGFGQVSCAKIDKQMRHIISLVANDENFGGIISQLVGDKIDISEVETERDTAEKALRQALGLQRKLESELDCLDITDAHYNRKYESLSRRLDDAFAAIDVAEQKVEDCEAKLKSIELQALSKDSVCESLKLYSKVFDKMNDHEKKRYVNSFIKSIEIYPDKKRSGGLIKTVHFKFPVAYNGESVYEFSPPLETTDETVVLLSKVHTPEA